VAWQERAEASRNEPGTGGPIKATNVDGKLTFIYLSTWCSAGRLTVAARQRRAPLVPPVICGSV
jgi:hypothetical protein